MGITKMSKVGFTSASYLKSDSFLVGNAAFSPNSYESIQTVTVGSGGQASATFTSIPATYTHLQIRITAQSNRGTYAIDDIRMRLNSDTASNYSAHILVGSGTAASSYAESSTTSILTGDRNVVTSVITNTFGVGVIDILDYKSTTKAKTIRSLSGGDSNGVGASSYFPSISLSSGAWYKNSSSVYEAVNTILLYPEYGTLFTQYSSFALYGIKGA
jgi:hypothetical protein